MCGQAEQSIFLCTCPLSQLYLSEWAIHSVLPAYLKVGPGVCNKIMKYRHRTRSYAGQYRAGIRRYCPCTHSYSYPVSISNIIPAEDSVHMNTIVTLKFDLLHITRALLAAHPVTNLRGWFVFLCTARKFDTALQVISRWSVCIIYYASMQAIPALIRALVPTFAVNHTSLLGHDLKVPLHSTEVISGEPRREVTVSKKSLLCQVNDIAATIDSVTSLRVITIKINCTAGHW